ncbi:MAG TPA: glutathione S-transferase N-terminal domain-containing protein [Nevskiaceae bacterium]|nr:glutathione S-transferase N-terminal domain-containing protein [Nevskiaceae bacterium]
MSSRYAARHSTPVKPALNAGLSLFVEPDAPQSVWLRIVLGEKAVDGSRVEAINVATAGEDFFTLSPTGTLPVLADRTGVVTGAVTIAEYLDERYPHPPLMPLGPAPRAQARMFMQQFQTALFPAAAEASAAAGLPEVCRRLLEDAARRFAGRTGQGLCGRGYTLVDAALVALLYSLRRTGVTLPDLGPGFERQSEALFERPAVAQALGACQ